MEPPSEFLSKWGDTRCNIHGLYVSSNLFYTIRLSLEFESNVGLTASFEDIERRISMVGLYHFMLLSPSFIATRTDSNLGESHDSGDPRHAT